MTQMISEFEPIPGPIPGDESSTPDGANPRDIADAAFFLASDEAS